MTKRKPRLLTKSERKAAHERGVRTAKFNRLLNARAADKCWPFMCLKSNDNCACVKWANERMAAP